MNLKKIFSLLVLVSTSINVFALELYKGKIINQRSWSTDSKKVELAINQNISVPRADTPNYQYLYSDIHSTTSKISMPVIISHEHGVGLSQDQENPKNYSYTLAACSEASNGNLHCVYLEKMIGLEKGGYFYEDTAPQLKMTYDKPGTYKIFSYTTLRGMDNPVSSWAFSYSYGVVIVS